MALLCGWVLATSCGDTTGDEPGSASTFSETVIYEITKDGHLTPQVTVPGYSIVLVEVR